MRKKERKLVVTFTSVMEAMAMDELGKIENLGGRLIPVPVEIKAGCGMAYVVSIERREQMEDYIEKHKLRIEGIVEFLV